MPAKRKAAKARKATKSKKAKAPKTKKKDQLWCTDDIIVDANGDLRIYNAYLCAAITQAIADANAAGHNLKIVCSTGGGTGRDTNPQCMC